MTTRAKDPLTPLDSGENTTPPAVVLSGAISAVLTGPVWARGSSGDANHGKILGGPCQNCRSLDMNDVGPRHPGDFGLEAASLSVHDYFHALEPDNIVLNQESLKCLTDPQTVAPDAKMFFHLDNPRDLADVITYLKEREK